MSQNNKVSDMSRRKFISLAAAGVGTAAFWRSPLAWTQSTKQATPNHFELRIAPVKVELAPGVVIETVGYNGKVPGPILRVKEGEPVDIHVVNHSDVPELVHWHGLHIDAINDGSSEEGSPVIAPGGELSYRFTPAPSGSRWYHTHAMAHNDLRRAGYSGQYGFLYIEPKSSEPGAYDHEVFLAVHHWEPFVTHGETPLAGHEVGYKYASFNNKLGSAQEPLRVTAGQRILFRFLNASATRNVQIALPNHQFRVIALDGNPVPSPQLVSVISLAVAERVDAVVEMTSPGVWMLGAVDDEDRGKGLGLPIEYAGQKGPAMWTAPARNDWSYALFGNTTPAAAFTKRVPMIFEKAQAAGNNAMDRWTINGSAYPEIAPLQVKKGDRYRLAFYNTSGEAHPMHLHRHSFELAAINGKPISGVFKDVVNVDAYGRIDVDFVAENPGPSLFHCHQQMHMDYGFMQLIEYLPES
jgi:FtsP/CotA-like multicopper oxidase with cupredoxin domain